MNIASKFSVFAAANILQVLQLQKSTGIRFVAAGLILLLQSWFYRNKVAFGAAKLTANSLRFVR